MAILRILSIVVLAAAAARWEAEPPRYTIESLGPIQVAAVNDSGWISGGVGTMDRQRAIVQIRGRRHAVEGLGDLLSHAIDLNASGVAVGTTWTTEHSTFAFAWREGNTTRLPVPDGIRGSAAFGINGRGEIVGHGGAVGRQVALVWHGDSVRSLPPLQDGGSAEALAVNDSGWIVGESQAGGRRRAVLWRGAGPVELGTPSGFVAVPVDINDRGQVVGELRSPQEPRAFLWENGRTTELSRGALPTAINNQGQVVGSTIALGRDSRAVLWEGGRMEHLDDLVPAIHGWRLHTATDINERGWIVGMGWRAGEYEAWLMKPMDADQPSAGSGLAVAWRAAVRKVGTFLGRLPG